MAAKVESKGSPKVDAWKQRGITRHRIEVNLGGRDYVFRSPLELRVGRGLASRGVVFNYETLKVPYVVPQRDAKYTPDFILPNGIVVEAKGLFDAKDREKLILVKAQHPDLDIRLVFQSAATRIYPGSDTTVTMWADKHGFPFAIKEIPNEWLAEPPRRRQCHAMRGRRRTLRRPPGGW